MTILKVAGVVVAIGLAAVLTAAYAAFGAFLPWNEEAEVERLARVGRVLPGQTVAESTVRNHVRERRRVLGLEARQTFVPQSYAWGAEGHGRQS